MRTWLEDLVEIERMSERYVGKRTFWGFGKTYYHRLAGAPYSWEKTARRSSWFGEVVGLVDDRYEYTREQAIRRAINSYDRRPAWQRFFIRLFTNIEWYRSFICANDLWHLLTFHYKNASHSTYLTFLHAYGRIQGTPPEWDLDGKMQDDDLALVRRYHSETLYDPRAYKIAAIKLARTYLIKKMVTTQKIMSADPKSSWQANGLNDWNILEQLKKISRYSSFKKAAIRLVALLENPETRQEMMDFQGELEISTTNSTKLVIHANPNQGADDEACLKLLGLWEVENVTGPVLEEAYRKAMKELHPDRLALQKTKAEKSGASDPFALTDQQAAEKTQILNHFMERAREYLSSHDVLVTSRKKRTEFEENSELITKGLAEMRQDLAAMKKQMAACEKVKADAAAVQERPTLFTGSPAGAGMATETSTVKSEAQTSSPSSCLNR